MKISCKEGALLITLLLSLSGCGGGPCCKQDNNRSDTSAEMPMEEGMMMDDGMMMDMGDDMDVADSDVRSLFEDEFMSVADGQTDDFDTTDDVAWIEESPDELKAVFYGYDKSQPISGQNERISYNVERLQELLADAQEEGRDAKVVIEGHSCSAGKASSTYKLVLSEKRAKAVADALVACGINRNDIKVVGRGAEMPMMREGEPVAGTADEQAPNRRVEMHVIYS